MRTTQLAPHIPAAAPTATGAPRPRPAAGHPPCRPWVRWTSPASRVASCTPWLSLWRPNPNPDATQPLMQPQPGHCCGDTRVLAVTGAHRCCGDARAPQPQEELAWSRSTGHNIQATTSRPQHPGHNIQAGHSCALHVHIAATGTAPQQRWAPVTAYATPTLSIHLTLTLIGGPRLCLGLRQLWMPRGGEHLRHAPA